MAYNLRTDLNPAEVALSRFVYELYSGVPGKRSPLSDNFAASMRHSTAILDLATHLAKVAKPDFDGEVIGFFYKPNLTELWRRAYRELQSAHSNVEFDPAFAEGADDVMRPGIRGDGINVMSVNGAIIKVLWDNELDYFITSLADFMATHQDKAGWVYSRAGIN